MVLLFYREDGWGWFADSGATQHMTDNKSVLQNFIPIEPGRWKVAGIGGTTLDVCGQGDISVRSMVDGKTHQGK